MSEKKQVLKLKSNVETKLNLQYIDTFDYLNKHRTKDNDYTHTTIANHITGKGTGKYFIEKR